ncbi:MAG: cob(I)yrinic acid a,c-diamide adenosyltransferase [bacterium]
MAERTGTVQLYTGDGKGKTTAALGCALRAIGHGAKVFMVQFMKGDTNYGELKAKVPRLKIVQSGLPTFVNRDSPSQKDRALARKGLELAKDAISSGRYDMVILDEVNVAVDYGLVPVDELVRIIRMRPDSVEVILTGRYAHEKLIDLADMVSEIKEIKHHYRKGIQAREGIEY